MQEKNLKLVDKIMTALQSVEDPELLIDVVNLVLFYVFVFVVDNGRF